MHTFSTHGLASFPWKSVWKSKAPPRVAFFVWTAVHSKILTLDNLGRRGLVVVNRCWLCEADGESVDHLLLHCAVARDLWITFFARFGLCWVMPRSVKELLASWWTAGRTEALWLGKWSPIVSCGVFGRSETIDVSRACRGPERSSFTFFLLLLQAGSHRGLLAL
jgi:hypothetical protein